METSTFISLVAVVVLAAAALAVLILAVCYIYTKLWAAPDIE